MENGAPNWPNVSFPKVPESDEENICRNTSNSEEKIVPFKESLEPRLTPHRFFGLVHSFERSSWIH